jgi:nitrogen-specific signal transduction histidine kinase
MLRVTDNGTWSRLVDGLLRGIHHELNNRTAALAGVEQAIASGSDMTEPLREMLAAELVRMRKAVALMGRIPGSAPGKVEPLRVQDALEAALALASLHPTSRDTVFAMLPAGELPPVRADRAALERSLLVMLITAAPVAGDGRVTIECAGDDDRVLVRIAPGGRSSAPPEPEETKEAKRRAIAAWLRPSDGVFEPSMPEGACVVSFPAMAPRRAGP